MDDAGRPRIYPVIRVETEAQALAQAAIAYAHPVDGAFLIDHDGDHDRLARCIAVVRGCFPDRFLGANLVRTGGVDALALLGRAFPSGVPLDALWTDDAGVRINAPASIEPAGLTSGELHRETGWQGLHFGGVAFKYQAPVPDDDLPALGELARDLVDVPTTSGPGTGQRIATERLRLLRRGLGGHPLALASGVTPENAHEVVPFVDHILVSTGISDGNGIVAERLSALLAAVGASAVGG